MNLLESKITCVPIGPIEEATEVLLGAKGQEYTVQISELLPNEALFGPHQYDERPLKRLFKILAYRMGVTPETNVTEPVNLDHPQFKQEINTNGAIYSMKGKVYIGNVVSTEEGYAIQYGNALNSTPNSLVISREYLQEELSENPVDSARILIRPWLTTRWGGTPLGTDPPKNVGFAERMYPVIINLITGNDWPYFA